MPKRDSEEALEQEVMKLFEQLGFATQNCFYETMGRDGTLGRETRAEVLLVKRLRPALVALNSDLPAEAIDLAVEEITRDRSAMSMAAANQEIHKFLKNGVKVEFRRDDEQVIETVKVIDWKEPENNDFFLASQLWISGEIYTRRADLVAFVNGLPIVFMELKAAHKRLKDAYDNNLTDYRDTIPHVFWYAGFIILSNGSESKVGSTTSTWDFFFDWKKINSEGEEGIISVDTVVRGTCDPEKLLDILEGFVLFTDEKGPLVKIVAANNQYLGVNKTVEALKKIEQNKGKLGVFWHTTGSGKSYSMMFFTEKVLRKLPGNYTFLIITDRVELDKQIYNKFASAGLVTEKDVHAKNGEHLQRLLREDHRHVFTLIQKFQTRDGKPYPVLSKRSDIIVIADEAHRTQYDILALNMRNALPNAAFIGFTATPLMAGEERTREVFGDYVSIYNFADAVDDGVTRPLFYENRTPHLQLTNEQLNEDIYQVIEEADLDEQGERKIEREIAREYHLITRVDRLEEVAQDIVEHFVGRGFLGKGMVVSIDKATAVRMFDFVQKRWKPYLDDLRRQLMAASDEEERESLGERIKFMEETDMAVVVSPGQNEVREFRDKGLDIVPHRTRMVKEDMETKFKDPKDRFRLVFVCAMWNVGFDAPSCSTIYLDKPMKNHTLMQTISRANRVFQEKNNGIIVDYIGVFRNLQQALAIYGSGSGGGVEEGDRPIEDKSKLIDALRMAIADARAFCEEHDVDIDAIADAEVLERIKLLDNAVDAILINDESKQKCFNLSNSVDRLFRAVLPDKSANEFSPARSVLWVIAEKIRSLSQPADLFAVRQKIEGVLDRSIDAKGYNIEDPEYIVDLSKIDFEALKKRFEEGRKHIQIEQLRGAINRKLQQLVRRNKTRIDYLEKFQMLIEDYNTGAHSLEVIFDKLVEFTQELNEEEQRGIKEQLSEEELALFDLLTKPDMKLTKKEAKGVKKVARELLETLKREKLVLDWRKRQQTRAAVKVAIADMLDRLPETYSKEKYEEKCGIVFQHIYDSYYGEGRSVYAKVG